MKEPEKKLKKYVYRYIEEEGKIELHRIEVLQRQGTRLKVDCCRGTRYSTRIIAPGLPKSIVYETPQDAARAFYLAVCEQLKATREELHRLEALRGLAHGVSASYGGS